MECPASVVNTRAADARAPLAIHDTSSTGHCLDRTAPLRSVPPGRVLFWQDDHQQEEIEVVRGVVRAVRLLENGSRQILAFYWPGDIIHPAAAQLQCYTAEAVTACRLRYPRQRSLSAVGLRGVAQVLQEMLALVVAISKKTTAARVAWFLLRIEDHLPRDPRREGTLQVLLPRADIADYLGTSIETICRTLYDFQAKGLIGLPTRKTIRYLNRNGLELIAEG